MGAILGYFGFEDFNLIKRMSELEKHRALDGFKYYKDKNIVLGQGIFRIGKSERNYCSKPITNENEDIVLLCDGRIFKSDNIKKELESKGHCFKTDFSGEVILHLYEERGTDFLDEINGDFAFCIWDSKKKRLILCADHAGSKPIHYFQRGKEIVFASDIKPLLQYDKVEKKLDTHALDLLLTYLFLPTEDTLFKDIKKVMPSTYVVFEGGKKEVVKHFEIKENIDYSKSEGYYVKKVREELERAVEDRIIEGIPVHVSLGGLDSGSVTAILASKVDDVNTYTIAFDEKDYALNISRKVSQMYNTHHHEIKVDYRKLDRYYTDFLPYFNTPCVINMGALGVSSVFLKIKGKKSLFFNGESAGSVFGGGCINPMLKYKKLFHIFSKKMQSKEVQSLEEHYTDVQTPAFHFENYKSGNYPKNTPNPLFIYSNYLQDKKYCFVNRLIKLNIETKSYLDMLIRNEIFASRICSINNCVFLDKQLIRLSFHTPIKFKYKNNVNKIILSKAMRDFLPKGMKTDRTPLPEYGRQLFRGYFKQNNGTIKTLFNNSDIFRLINNNFKKQLTLVINNNFKKQLTLVKTNEFSFTKMRRTRLLLALALALGLWYEHYFNDEKISKYF